MGKAKQRGRRSVRVAYSAASIRPVDVFLAVSALSSDGDASLEPTVSMSFGPGSGISPTA